MLFLTKKTAESKLVNQHSFYSSFTKDLRNSRSEVIIESPYLTANRMESFYPLFADLITRNVRIHIMTRDPIEHDEEYMRNQATNEILRSVECGINVILLTGYHHRKIAIIDRHILWEGSLNILSYNNSQEIMRRIDSEKESKQMLSFLKLEHYL